MAQRTSVTNRQYFTVETGDDRRQSSDWRNTSRQQILSEFRPRQCNLAQQGVDVIRSGKSEAAADCRGDHHGRVGRWTATGSPSALIPM
jgi:hypothetical protein